MRESPDHAREDLPVTVDRQRDGERLVGPGHADIAVDGGAAKRVLFPHSFHDDNFWELTVPVTLRRGVNKVTVTPYTKALSRLSPTGPAPAIQDAVTDRELLDTIDGTPWIAGLLTLFDFEIARAADGPIEPVSLPGGEPLEPIAGDSCGGTFLLVGAGAVRPVLYVGSEGEGGLIATSLRDALTLVVGVSNLHDATTFPVDEDDGRALRDFLARADDEIREDWPALDDDRDRLREALGLPPVDDALLRSLQAAAADIGYRPINERGHRLRPMPAWLEDAEEAEYPVVLASPEPPAPPVVRPDEPMPGQLGLF